VAAVLDNLGTVAMITLLSAEQKRGTIQVWSPPAVRCRFIALSYYSFGVA